MNKRLDDFDFVLFLVPVLCCLSLVSAVVVSLFKVGHTFRAATFYQIGFVLYKVAFIESVVLGAFAVDVEFIKEKRKATVASGCSYAHPNM